MKSSTFKRIMSFMKGFRIHYLIGILGFSLLTFLFQATIAYLFLNLFDTLADGSFEELIRRIFIYLVYLLIIVAILPLFSYLTQSASVNTSGNLRKHVFRKLTRLPMGYFQNNHSATTIFTITQDVAEAERAYSEHMIHLLSRIIMGIGTLIVMFMIDWRLALIPVIGAVFTIIVNRLYANKLREVSKEVQENLASVNTRFSNLLAGINVIRIFNIQNILLDKFKKSNNKALSASNKRVNNLSKIHALNDLIYTLGFAGIALFGAFLVLEGLSTIGVIVAIVQLQNGVSDLVRYIGNFIANLQTSLAAGDRVFMLLDEVEEPVHFTGVTVSSDEDNAIAFDGVTFGYDENHTIINQMTLEIRQHQKVALVGPSGGGKSTLFKLLLQYYPPKDGTMTLQGNTDDTISIKTIRSQIAYVPQNAFLFNTTIKENISFGSANASDEEIINAAKLANAHEFITSLPDGYNTLVGEQGARLSGGQRQRIAIARAMIKDAPILLLDEATSALDNESELLIKNALDTLMKNKTSLVIAHRLSTIEDADTILVISEGKLVEQGSHADLLSIPKGLYTHLFKKQHHHA